MSRRVKAPAAPRSRRRLAAATVVALAVVGAAVWWLTRRPDVPDPPAPDLSRTDPEVAAAVREATDRVRQNPADGPAWGRLGMVYRAHDFDTEAMAAFRTAERLDPDDYRWPYVHGLSLVRHDPAAGLECLRRAADRAPAARPEPKLRQAAILLERGQAEEAGRLLDEVRAAHPRNPQADWLTARAAADRADWAGAFDRAARCRSDPSCQKKAAMLRGEALARLGRSSEADAELRAAAEMPDDLLAPDPVVEEVQRLKTGALARVEQAAALFHQGAVREAVAALREAIRRSPDDPEPRLALAQMLNRTGDPTAALQLLTERRSDTVEGWFQVGVARFQLGETAAAAEAFRKVLALKPDHSLAYFNLGHCHRKLGDRTAARSAFEQALRCRSDHEPSRQAIRELDAGK